jgi:hypothetical protein
MNRFFVFLAALALTVSLARAGDCMSGSSCCNQCPLAKEANTRMSDGREGLATSAIVRSDIVRRVLLNLETL